MTSELLFGHGELVQTPLGDGVLTRVLTTCDATEPFVYVVLVRGYECPFFASQLSHTVEVTVSPSRLGALTTLQHPAVVNDGVDRRELIQRMRETQRRYLVIAPSQRVFIQWCGDRGLTTAQATYVTRVWQLRGQDPTACELVVVGTRTAQMQAVLNDPIAAPFVARMHTLTQEVIPDVSPMD